MSRSVPASPQFGDPLPLDPAPEVLAFLARRRSASAVTLHAPGPSPEELDDLLRLAARAPDHGKLAPWRFIVFEGEAKAAALNKLKALAEARADAPRATAALGKFSAPPLAVCVVSSTIETDIPEWEQILSAGAVCMNLLNAATAMGYGANWITDWYAFDEGAKAALGVAVNERVAGFIYMGTASEAPLERVRPNLEGLVTRP